MDRSTSGMAIRYAVAAAVGASIVALLAGMLVFGFDLGQWAEWEGRVVGVAGTVAGVAGAVIGLRLRDGQRKGN